MMSRDLVSSTLAGDAPCVVGTSWGAETSRHAFVSPTEGKQKYVLLFVRSFTDTHCKHVWTLWRPTNPYRSQPEKAHVSKRAHTLQIKHKNQAVLIHSEHTNVNRLSIKCTETSASWRKYSHRWMTHTEQFLSEKTVHVFKGEKRWEAIQRWHVTGSANRTGCAVGLRWKERGPGIPV